MDEHGFGTVLFARLSDFLFEDLIRLVPRDGNELGFTALPDALHRRLDSLRAIYMLYFRDAFRANRPIAFILIGIVRLYHAEAPITNRAFQRAVASAMGAMVQIGNMLLRLGHRRCRR